ncbi:protocatechuate 3,4-dioxygenase subunit alpha [Cecembia sp.]|uniref:protocatechuate 3,4-dioxygenase subunit alpha n=1 Tax=Cecembia sp. TaxID=1898110 RepID=UPI0025BD8C9B|nr:protocatechuate 3,4-dioxygenase subunit alpha [Cecembia sp.]
MNKLGQTPSQTVGPYFAYGLTPEQYKFDHTSLATPVLLDARKNSQDAIILRGKVYDLHGEAVDDAMIEIWQVDQEGKFQIKPHQGFFSIGRMGTGTIEGNWFEFTTCIPAAEKQGQAPAIHMIVFMRGLLSHVYTRVYFEDFKELNQEDPYLKLVTEERRSTLIAQKVQESPVTIYEFNLHMQGENETVFFDY